MRAVLHDLAASLIGTGWVAAGRWATHARWWLQARRR